MGRTWPILSFSDLISRDKIYPPNPLPCLASETLGSKSTLTSRNLIPNTISTIPDARVAPRSGLAPQANSVAHRQNLSGWLTLAHGILQERVTCLDLLQKPREADVCAVPASLENWFEASCTTTSTSYIPASGEGESQGHHRQQISEFKGMDRALN